MPQFMYQCPHCFAQEEVAHDMIGRVVQCESCGQPYRPEVPVAKMMQQSEDGAWAISPLNALGQRASREKTIMTVHPAMFRSNPIRYSGLVLAFIIGLAGMVFFGAQIEESGADQLWWPIAIVLSIVFGIVAIVSLISLIYWLVCTRFESLTVTNERTIFARGVFERETSDVQHDDVRNIQVKLTLIDRVLGVGRIAISSAGQDDMEIDVRGIPNPNQLADTVRSWQARMHGRDD